MEESLTDAEIEALVREAADPTTPAVRLEAIYWDKSDRAYGTEVAISGKPVETALAGNPNTPPEIVRSLGQCVPRAVAHNPALPLLLLEQPNFFRLLGRVAAGELLRSPDTPVFVLRALNWHQSRELERAILQHVQIRGEAGKGWREEVQTEEERLPVGVNPALRELVELGLAPERVLRALGEAASYADRRLLLTAAVRSPAAAVIVSFLAGASGSPDLRRIAAPAVPLDTASLRRLAGGGPWAQAIVARSMGASSEVLAQVADSRDWKVRAYAARHPGIPPEVMTRLVSDPHLRVRIAAVRNERCPEVELVRLAPDPEARVRGAVARHPAAPVGVLEALAQDADPVVRIAVARHPRTPEARRKRLLTGSARRQERASGVASSELPREAGVGDGTFPVGAAVVARPQPKEPLSPPTDPGALLRWLLEGPSEQEPAAHAAPLSLREVLLRSDPHPWQVEARRHIAEDPAQSPEVLAILAEHHLPTVRARAGGNPACPPALFPVLAKLSEFPIPQRLASNPRLPAEIQLELAKLDGWGVSDLLLRNPALAPEVLAELAGNSAPITRAAVARHPGCSAELRARLATDPVRQVRCEVARATRWAPEVLDRMVEPALREATRDSDPLVRWIAFSHPRTPAESLASGLDSARWRDRLALASNPALPEAIRAELREDGMVLVRAAARATMGEQEVDSQS